MCNLSTRTPVTYQPSLYNTGVRVISLLLAAHACRGTTCRAPTGQSFCLYDWIAVIALGFITVHQSLNGDRAHGPEFTCSGLPLSAERKPAARVAIVFAPSVASTSGVAPVRMHSTRCVNSSSTGWPMVRRKGSVCAPARPSTPQFSQSFASISSVLVSMVPSAP